MLPGTEVDYPATIWRIPGINNYGKTLKENDNPYPLAYFSVAIFVEAFPPQEVMDEMLLRVKDFCQNPQALSEREGIRPRMGIEKLKSSLNFTEIRLLEPELKTEYVEIQKVSQYKTTRVR